MQPGYLHHEMIFTNARLIFPDGICDGFEIVVQEGKIAAIRDRSLAHRKDEVIDLNGNYLAPGFIDLHVHGALGRDTMEASAEVPGALEAIELCRARGISVSGGHTDAWDEEARAAFDRGMRSVTHTFNCMSTARRRGVYRVAGLLEFALSEPDMSCELIAD